MKKRKSVSANEYDAIASEIIERDFFPEVHAASHKVKKEEDSTNLIDLTIDETIDTIHKRVVHADNNKIHARIAKDIIRRGKDFGRHFEANGTTSRNVFMYNHPGIEEELPQHACKMILSATEGDARPLPGEQLRSSSPTTTRRSKSGVAYANTRLPEDLWRSR